LRARYLSSATGRFLSRDEWAGDYNRPASYNAWLYAYSDPVNVLDPSGLRGEWWHELMQNQTWQTLFLEIARRHNRTSSGLTNEQFSGVLAAIISVESDTLAGAQATHAPNSPKGKIGKLVNDSPEWIRIKVLTAPAKDWEIVYTNKRGSLAAGIVVSCGLAAKFVAPHVLKFLPNEQSLGMGNIDAGRVRELKTSSVSLYDYSGTNNPIQQNSSEYLLYPSDTAAQSLEWLGASFELLLRDSEKLGADLTVDKYGESVAVSARSFAQFNRTGLVSGLEGYFNDQGQPYWATNQEIIRAKQSVASKDAQWAAEHELAQSQAEQYWDNIKPMFDCATNYLKGLTCLGAARP
jgi:hypothetical protein